MLQCCVLNPTITNTVVIIHKREMYTERIFPLMLTLEEQFVNILHFKKHCPNNSQQVSSCYQGQQSLFFRDWKLLLGMLTLHSAHLPTCHGPYTPVLLSCFTDKTTSGVHALLPCRVSEDTSPHTCKNLSESSTAKKKSEALCAKSSGLFEASLCAPSSRERCVLSSSSHWNARARSHLPVTSTKGKL
ncbi:hypothetical protein EK904_013967 [Melospiza melodia maxima]|nr:hypothetical protein EK904_013967 [Melospiza melodia maxima]